VCGRRECGGECGRQLCGFVGAEEWVSNYGEWGLLLVVISSGSDFFR